MSIQTIDLATFAELQDTAGADFVNELVQTFFEEAPAMLKELRDTRAAGDADAFRRAAHSLKSNSLTFGARALGAAARDLEVRAADVVGARLQRLGGTYQVLCITHLPQIAAYGSTHYRIVKRVSGGRTLTDVARVEGVEREQELARMIGGADVSPAVLASARDMLASRGSQPSARGRSGEISLQRQRRKQSKT